MERPLVFKAAVAESDAAPDVFSIAGLVKRFREALFRLSEHRKGVSNQRYEISDAGLSAPTRKLSIGKTQ